MLRGIAGRLAPGGPALLRPQPSLLPRRHLFHALSAPDAARGAAARARPAARVARKCVCSSAADAADGSLVRETRFREIYEEIARGALISRNDLKLGLERAVPGCQVSNDQVDRMMRVADLDSSGHVDYSEFRFLFDDIHDDDISLSSLAETWLGFSDSVKDPTIIFNMAWRRLISAVGGERNVRLPTEIMFLGGAPGAGKGTMTPYIMWERGLEGSPVVMSSLLNSPQAKKIIDEGGLVGDMEVFTMLLDELASPSQRLGSLVDGFPRTVAQVQLLQLLHAKMSELSRTYDHTELQSYFPRPRFRMCILFVDEHVSIERQLSRGRQALEHNKSVADAGEGELLEVRDTDLSVKAAKNRYRLFVEGTMSANEALKQSFPFNLINAAGSVEEVRHVVMQELSYQSSLELQEDTYNAIKHIPTAAEITTRARQNLVSRLDGYMSETPATFVAVIEAIESEFMPSIKRHALVGEARLVTKAHVFSKSALALDMLIDVMYDRGFSVSGHEQGENQFHFTIRFEPPQLHNAAVDKPGKPNSTMKAMHEQADQEQ